MKNKFLVFGMAILLIASSLSFVGCKKGENDPGLSLKSRTARITGEWEMSKGEWENTYTNTNAKATSIIKYTYSFDNGTLSQTSYYSYDGNSETTTLSIENDYKLTINKDGTYKLEDKRTWNVDGDVYTTNTKHEGNWSFVYGNDNLEVKNKERVEFTITKLTEVDTDGETSIYNYSGKSYDGDYLLLLDKLASDEMTAIIDTKYVNESLTNESTGSQTFVKLD